MKFRSLKSGTEGSKLSTGVFILWFISHKGTPTSTLSKHSLRVLLLGNQVFSADSTTITLIPISTKELVHEGRGSPRPPYKDVVAAPHQVGGSMTCRRATNALRGRHTKSSLWFTQEPITRHSTLLVHSLKS